jgi:alanyl-tRNA synthetase
MNRQELINKYINFFKLHNHAQIKNSSLVPENDPTVLFTTAGMHPLVPYLLGEKHPQGKRLVNVQRCIRTGDIEEVGDATHHTFFEMTGNWSLGDYWKKEAIEMSFEFATKELCLPIERIAVTAFEGYKNVPRDEESVEIWKELGIPKEKIAYLPREDNWWGPAGQTGPCGPCTELFYWKPNDIPVPEIFDPADEENWVEIWNDVLMEYNKDVEGSYAKASQQNIDNGRGLERMLAVINGFDDNYLTEAWRPIIQKIELLSNKPYEENKKPMRIIADHVKAAIFIINDGITPSNTEQGYVLRRLIRRAIRFARLLSITNFTAQLAEPIYQIYSDYQFDKEKITLELQKEEQKFNQTLEKGLRTFSKKTFSKQELDGQTAFLLYQSYGFPIEMTEELCREQDIKLDKQKFNLAKQQHKILSQTASVGRFKSGLADNSESTTKLHTVCHILNEALRQVLKTTINQKGSNITPERLRFDFTFDRKLTEEEIRQIENLVNSKIQENLTVKMEEMSLDDAKENGAYGIFDDKYGEKVKVYTIGDFSKEICAGPHIQSTSELGTFKIKSQKSVGAGARRIKAILE